MNQGVQPSGIWAEPEEPEAPVVAPAAEPMLAPMVEVPASRRWPERLIGAALSVVALAWIGLLAWQIGLAGSHGLTPLRLAAWVGLGTGPLSLLALLYLLLLRTGRAEANRYARAAGGLRAESDALIQAMALMGERIDAARRDLADQATRLAGLGEEASARMRGTAGELAGQAEGFARAATGFDDATARARSDMGVLLDDLPRAEVLVVALADRLRVAGDIAGERAAALSNGLAELDERARAAGEQSAGAASRLASQLDRIEASAAAADRRMGEAAQTLGRAVDIAFEAASESVEETRRAVAAQAEAMMALGEQGRASVGSAGDEAVRVLGARLDELVGRVDGIGAGLRSQELAARGLLTQLEQAIGVVEERFQALGDKGAEHTADLAEAIVALSDHVDGVGRTLGAGAQTADALAGRIIQIRQQADASVAALTDTIPAALSRIRLHAEQSLQAISGAHGRAEGLAGAAASIAERLAEADALLERQQGALDQADTLAGRRLSALHDQAAELAQLLAKADAEIHALSEGATGPLIEALLRVRETASQAADHARDALTAAIPRVAQRLSEAATREMTAAIANVGQSEIAAVGTASERAVEAARAAAERLTRHMLTIAETATAIEGRIEENRQATEAHDDAAFARSVSLLIEALNSTAIDLEKLFAIEVSDEAWKAYLRGDRGIFTRRAVKLIDRQEAGAIAQRYRNDDDFREQVNRYIHDFEALLRRIMATREGEAIATTMLSSDAGKLYVALAQAIERLR